MAELTVGTWNALNQFGNERAPAAVRTLERLEADVLFIGETALLGEERSEHFVAAYESMHGLGYEVRLVSGYYSGPKDRANQHLMSMWSRIGGDIERESLGNRYGMRWTQPESPTVWGVHPDDKNKALREVSAEALSALAQNRKEPQVLMGDFNDMYPDSWRARAARLGGRVARVPEEGFYPQENESLSAKIRREIRGRATRLGEMASGSSLEIYRNAGFVVDADPKRRPTIHFGPVPAFQLDYILGRDVHFLRFKRHPRDGSDHAPITAVVEY